MIYIYIYIHFYLDPGNATGPPKFGQDAGVPMHIVGVLGALTERSVHGFVLPGRHRRGRAEVAQLHA